MFYQKSTIGKFECSPLVCELKKETDISGKQYKGRR